MSASIHELLLAYSTLGIRHWKNQTNLVKIKARKIGVDIVTNMADASQAVSSPFVTNGQAERTFKLIPMPCDQKKVYAAFFAPWLPQMISLDLPNLSFDLVVLTPQGESLAFRFEPASTHTASRHRYDHVQISESLGQKTVPLTNTVPHLPTTYPAIPIPSRNPLTRFLAMAMTMHGFPDRITTIIEHAFNGRANLKRMYTKMTSALVAR